jgi:hypothetical protein
MSLLAHLVWLAVLLVLGTLAILSIWSDVWELYVSIFVIAALISGFTWWRKRPQ